MKENETEREAEEMIESTSYKTLYSSIDRRFELMALISPWESERSQIRLKSEAEAWRRAPLIARASAISGEETAV